MFIVSTWTNNLSALGLPSTPEIYCNKTTKGRNPSQYTLHNWEYTAKQNAKTHIYSLFRYLSLLSAAWHIWCSDIWVECSQMLSFRGQVVRTTYIHLSGASSICCCMCGVRQCVRCDVFAPQDCTLTQSGSKWLERLGPVTNAQQTS